MNQFKEKQLSINGIYLDCWPAIISISNGVLGWQILRTQKEIEWAQKKKISIFEDWETANKVGFCVSIENGQIVKGNSSKGDFFNPDLQEIPGWASSQKFQNERPL